jgi:hypothetical protein
MGWIPGESIFDRLLSIKDTPKNEYYQCEKKGVKYVCKVVEGEHRIVPIYPDVPRDMHIQILEGVLNAPVTIQ